MTGEREFHLGIQYKGWEKTALIRVRGVELLMKTRTAPNIPQQLFR
jgi:hypothetical protein